MHPAQPQYDVGVLIGRFQVPELHDAHLELIQYVVDRHQKVMILLGNAPIPNSINNPLDYHSRVQMIRTQFPIDKYPGLDVRYLDDTRDNDSWTRNADREVVKFLDPGQSVMLYGGRDSFIPAYTGVLPGGQKEPQRTYIGKFPTQELTQETFESGTAVRKAIHAGAPWNHEAYRAALVKASMSRYPTAFPTVDMAIWDIHTRDGVDSVHILLGRRPTEKLFRFPGGFVDPEKDASFMDAAIREAHEECGMIELGAPQFVTNRKIDDWRYAKEKDKIFTTLFSLQFLFGKPVPSDDLDGGELKWFSLDTIKPTDVVPEHRPLLDDLLTTGI